jgi:hypothetical protein
VYVLGVFGVPAREHLALSLAATSVNIIAAALASFKGCNATRERLSPPSLSYRQRRTSLWKILNGVGDSGRQLRVCLLFEGLTAIGEEQPMVALAKGLADRGVRTLMLPPHTTEPASSRKIEGCDIYRVGRSRSR